MRTVSFDARFVDDQLTGLINAHAIAGSLADRSSPTYASISAYRAALEAALGPRARDVLAHEVLRALGTAEGLRLLPATTQTVVTAIVNWLLVDGGDRQSGSGLFGLIHGNLIQSGASALSTGTQPTGRAPSAPAHRHHSIASQKN